MASAAVFESPCVKGWIYSRKSGRCYTFGTEAKSYKKAQEFCSNKTLNGAFQGRTDLGQLEGRLDEDGLKEAWLKIQPHNREPHWVLKGWF